MSTSREPEIKERYQHALYFHILSRLHGLNRPYGTLMLLGR